MTRTQSITKALVLGAAAAILATACVVPPPALEDDMPPALFFQRAQEAADNGHWDNALIYYNTFLERFPEDQPNGLAARYEIAFIHYKKGEYETAKELFTDLLNRYKEITNPLSVPQWPRVLAEKLLPMIEEKAAQQAPQPEPAQPQAPEETPPPAEG